MYMKECVFVEICYENFWPTPKNFRQPKISDFSNILGCCSTAKHPQQYAYGHGPFFRGSFGPPISESWGRDLNQIWEKDTAIIGAPGAPLDLGYVASLWNQSALNWTGVENRGQISYPFHICKNCGTGRRNVCSVVSSSA